MARYIDADKLIAHLKDEIEGCKQPFGTRANGKGIAYGTELGLKSAISFAKTLSTADVVPKSEVEKVVGQIAQQEMDSYEAIYKQEVAREIFEEIERNLVNANFITGNVELNFGYYLTLKKKYTESVIVGEWKFAEKISHEQPDLSDVKFIDSGGNIINRDDGLDWNETPLWESEDKE